jgi:hypothetical protein
MKTTDDNQFTGSRAALAAADYVINLDGEVTKAKDEGVRIELATRKTNRRKIIQLVSWREALLALCDAGSIFARTGQSEYPELVNREFSITDEMLSDGEVSKILSLNNNYAPAEDLRGRAIFLVQNYLEEKAFDNEPELQKNISENSLALN